MNFVRIALDVPLPTLFDYRAPDANGEDVGRRVLVPFGKRIAVGVIMEYTQATSLQPQRVRRILSILRDVPPLPHDVLALLKFCSDYYHHPLGEVVLNALPTRLRRRHALKPQDHLRYRLTAAGRALDLAVLPQRAVVKLELLRRLRDASEGLDAAAVRALAPRAPATLKALITTAWAEPFKPALATAAPTIKRPGAGPTLSNEQQLVVTSMGAAPPGFVPWLLQGVTGSGKTEIYFDLIAQALAGGRQTLLLVPEINLTPQLEARVRARFPEVSLVALHSGLNESERSHNWLAAHAGLADIVLGTRLAVFTPMPRLGLIIVDEEHDASFKQNDGLRYSARDIALLRAKRLAIPIVLGSATPSLETFYHAQRGLYRHLSLTQRVNAELPDISYINTRQESLIDGVSQTLLRALKDNLARNEQSLVFINRRGYAPVLYCAACGWIPGCRRCSAKLVVHLKNQHLHCHYCGHQERIPAACSQCGNQDLTPLGQGTQRVEATLARIFPTARLLRIDSDSTRRKNTWQEMRRQIHAHEVDILVGTQILAKGHDFPQLTLVGVINADSSLYSTDFRAGERLFAGLTQVAGRAGRAARPGRVLIQTEFPTHPLYSALQRHDYAGFAQQILEERKQAGFPPFTHQAVLRAAAPQMATALAFLKNAARSAQTCSNRVTIYDPVPAAMPRLAGLDRAQLMVQSRSRSALQTFLRDWVTQLHDTADHRVRWSLDVDPQEF